MSTQPISPIITKHLDALVHSAAHTIPSSFQGATGQRHRGYYYGDLGLISRRDVHPAMHELSPPSLFIAYAEEYITDPQLFERDSVKASLDSFLRELDFVIDAAEQDELGRYNKPAWQPAANLHGKDLRKKSDDMQKIHAIDAMIENPNLLIAYAVVDAIFRDFYGEQKRYFEQPVPAHVLSTNWSIVAGAARVLNDTLNNSGVPDVGIFHGPVVQGYFHHIQRVVNEGGTFGDISANDIREHLGLLSPAKMFEGYGTVCPVKEIFIAAAIGVGRKSSPTGVRREQRLWSIYQRAKNEAGDLQQLVTTTIKSRFDIAVYNMRGHFKRPQPRTITPTTPDDLSGGQK